MVYFFSIFLQGWGNRKGNVWLQLRRIPSQPTTPHPDEHLKIAEIKPERLGVAPHSMAKATDTITDSEDIVKLAKPGDYYQVRAHHMFSRILNFLFLFVTVIFLKITSYIYHNVISEYLT